MFDDSDARMQSESFKKCTDSFAAMRVCPHLGAYYRHLGHVLTALELEDATNLAWALQLQPLSLIAASTALQR